MLRLRATLLALVLAAPPALADCADQAGACDIANGTYEIALPESGGKNAPVLVFLHGYGGSGMGAMKLTRVTRTALERGYAVLAPNALRRGGEGPRAWNFHPERSSGRDEAAFLSDVITNASTKFGLNRQQVLLSGFSIGGSMTSYLACNSPDMFTAYAPISGSFWRPHPIKCTAPVRLFHTHGWADGTVPLEGRTVGSGFTQGDVFHALGIWRKTNLCTQPRPKKFSKTGQFMRRKWTECTPDSALEFALFPGGHVVPKGWTNMALDWFEQTQHP